ncbi:MAG TPA: galactokinase [Steroidobacteraceae bacterium]|nr:galactokinase [Steroidobacteraceae bacterium]
MEVFRTEPRVVSQAPGRVNLLGEHTDYTGGFVLPIGIRQTTNVEIAPSFDELFHVYSANLDEQQSFERCGPASQGFARYVRGCVEVLERAGYRVPAVCMRIDSRVPIGVGLSSSAALEVAVLRAMRQLLQFSLSDVDLALLAQQAEVEYAGVFCGVMDQMASSLGDREHMLYLDTRSLEYRRLPLPVDSEVMVLDSGTTRQLAGTAYNRRREECEAAASLLNVNTLRDADSLTCIDELPEPLNRRARHVITENGRVLDALNASAARFGALMNESHRSLRDDYEVSSPALDALADSLRREPAVYGARLTGAGFGGACVALVRRGEGADAAASALRNYTGLGFKDGRSLV